MLLSGKTFSEKWWKLVWNTPDSPLYKNGLEKAVALFNRNLE